MRQPPAPLTDAQRKLVEDNYKLVFAGMNKYYSSQRTIDRELMEAEFGFALCHAARTYCSSKGSFSGWAFKWFHNSFIMLLRSAYTRGITGVSKEIKCKTTAELKDRTAKPDRRLIELREMKEDFQARVACLPKLEREVIARRIRGDSFRKIGAAFDFSKQRAEQIQDQAIKRLGLAD